MKKFLKEVPGFLFVCAVAGLVSVPFSNYAVNHQEWAAAARRDQAVEMIKSAHYVRDKSAPDLCYMVPENRTPVRVVCADVPAARLLSAK